VGVKEPIFYEKPRRDRMKHYFGIDIGGTFIKGAIINECGTILTKDKIPTESSLGGDRIIDNVGLLCSTLLSRAKLELSDVSAIGIGVPGLVDGERGVVVKSGNLGLRNFEIKKKIEEKISLPCKVSNDANMAALGEMKYGYGGKYKNVFFNE
jgi:glucokinase